MILITYTKYDRDMFTDVRENYPFRILHHSEFLISACFEMKFKQQIVRIVRKIRTWALNFIG